MKTFKCELWSRESQSHHRAFKEQAFNLNEMVPSRKVADELLELYLDTFETTYRVIHIPTFLMQYSHYWDNPQKPDMAFVAQLLAVLAAGSCFHVAMEPEARETYPPPAMKWIMGVQSYISCAFVSPDIDLRMIQTQALLLIARLGVANDGDVSWASSGYLIRSAMTMGLHRDPTRFRKGGSSPFWHEMRRRLWATIVELDLKISLDRGVTPSVDLDECDCDAPSNWDDAQLLEVMEYSPNPPSTATYTRNFYQTLLAKSLPLRYRIAKRINALKFDLSYDDALRMGEEMLRFMKHAASLFEDNALNFTYHAARHQFAQSIHMFIMRKFLLALHRPFSLSVVLLPKCSYSRKICLEGALEILSLMGLPSAPAAVYPHITQLGSGMFRDEIFHAAVTVCVELSLQAQEMGQPGSAMDGMNSSVLMSMVQSQQSVMLQGVERTLHDLGRRIRATGTGSKPYFFLSLILASVKSRIKGEDPLSQVEAVSKKAVRVCRGRLNGLSFSDALAQAENQPMPVCCRSPSPYKLSNMFKTSIPDGTTPTSATSIDFDLPSLLSTDFGEFKVSLSPPY